jgi:RNA polymerase sigma-70 factor, ECF subfamily
MREAESKPDQPAAKTQPVSSERNDWDEWDAVSEARRAEMVESIYPQLKRIAEQHMRRERHDHTLQPTAVVSEFYLILTRQRQFTVRGRAHFLAFASRAMRRILIDYARHRGAERRGGAKPAVRLDPENVEVGPAAGSTRRSPAEEIVDALALDEAINRLQAEDPRAAHVVELKYYGGLTFEEISHVIGVDERTAKRDWDVAKALLFKFLESESRRTQ